MKSVAVPSNAMPIKVISTIRARVLIGLVVFLLAFGVRVLTFLSGRFNPGARVLEFVCSSFSQRSVSGS